MNLAERWRERRQPTLSFELFPPRTDKAAKRLGKVITKLTALNPDFVSVTFGAGGTTREGSYELVKKLKNECNLEVLAYFAGFGLSPEEITSVLDDYRGLGVENLLVVRGDRPRDEENVVPHPDALAHATDLLSFICPRYPFTVGVAGYPEGHVDAGSLEKDLGFLKQKIELGAQFAITNYTYDSRHFFDFVGQARSLGISVPIIAGVMPIYNLKMMNNLAKLCGATIPDSLRDQLAALPADDKDALNDFGVEFATNQCIELLDNGVAGIHIYTMDRAKSAVGMVQRLRDAGKI